MSCYICDPENPLADTEGCVDCDASAQRHAVALATARGET